MYRAWYHGNRYYIAKVYTNLFGEVVLSVAHGNKTNKLGKLRTYPLANYDEGFQNLRSIDKRRRQRGYLPAGA